MRRVCVRVLSRARVRWARLRREGTTVHLRPGTITGGRFEQNCGVERSITYFLEPLLLLAPFGKLDMAATLHGVRPACLARPFVCVCVAVLL